MDLATIFRQTVDRYPDRCALVDGSHRWSYADWYDRVVRVAHALGELGVRPHDRVAIFMPTSERAAATHLACQLLGAIAVPINFRLASGEVAHILADSGARVLVHDHSLTTTALAAADHVPSTNDLVVGADAYDGVTDGHHDFETLVEQADASDVWAAPSGDQLSALVYTSGTTGRPKGVMHTHANDVAIAMNCVMEYGLSSRDVALHIAPLYHVGGMQAFFIPHLMVGGTNVLLTRFDPVATLEEIEREHVTTLFAVPAQITQMLRHPRFDSVYVNSLRLITTGGAPISAAMMQRVITELCPNVSNGYGMTEASLALLLHPYDALDRLGSCGKPTLISTCRLVSGEGRVDPDDVVARGEVGQLIVRGPQVAQGYWNNPTETARKLHRGWLYTGDMLSQDQDGFYHFHGRMDDMIVSGGENIYPREVEEVIHRCPGVNEAAVVGLPDERWGHAVTAFVVPADPNLTEAAVVDFCLRSDDLASYKRPRAVIFVDSLPHNPSGKVVKRELIDRAAAIVHEIA